MDETLTSQRTQLNSLQFWLPIGVIVVALLILGWNVHRYQDNRAMQADIVSQRLYVNETGKFGRLNTQIVQTLATLSARTNDEELRQLLADHGYSFRINHTANATAANAQTGE